MANNEKIAADILTAVGGKENVTSATHCMTRLRLILKDAGITNEEAVKHIPGVLGVVQAGGQYQIIVGQNVPKVYAEFCKLTGLAVQAVIDENLDAPKEKLTLKKIGSNILDYLSGSMAMLIPGMVTAGMFKALMTLLGPGMLKVISADSDLYILLDFLYDAFFYFLPVFLGYSAAKKLDLDPIIGIYAGAILLVPDFMAIAQAGTSFTVFGIPCRTGIYSQTILPIILTVFAAKCLYGLFKKIVPDVLSTVFTPFLTILVLTPISLCALAPLGGVLGDLIGVGLTGFGEVGGLLGMVIFAGLWQFLVMTGMHVIIATLVVNNMAVYGFDACAGPAGICSTWAVFGMAFGAFLRLRSKDEKALSFSYFVAGIIGGVTEPALYGVGFRYKRPFIPLALGGAIGGAYAGIMHVTSHMGGGPGFLSVLRFVEGGTANLVNGTIGVGLSFVAAAVLTYLLGFPGEKVKG